MSNTLTHWAGALMRAASAPTRQQARDAINVAVLRGLPVEQARTALAQWDRVNGTPQTPDVCKCSHVRSRHSRDGSTCFATLCGCAAFRPTTQETT